MYSVQTKLDFPRRRVKRGIGYADRNRLSVERRFPHVQTRRLHRNVSQCSSRKKPARRSARNCGGGSESTTGAFEIARRTQVVGYPIPLLRRNFDDSQRTVGTGYVTLSA